MKKINVITLGCSKNTVDSRAPDGAARRRRVRGPLRQRPHRRQGRGDQHLRIHRRRQAGVDRHDSARRGGQAGRKDRTAVRRGMPLGTLRRRTAGRDSRGGRLFRRTHVGRHRPRTGSLGGPGAGHRTPSDDPEALRLPENFGRLQLEMRLLRHSAHPRRHTSPSRWRSWRRRPASSPHRESGN